MDYKTQDTILTELLNNVDDSYEKAPGYPTYDILKSCAIQLGLFYTQLKALNDLVDVDKLTGDDLAKYVLQRKGIVRKLANVSKGILTVNGTGTINTGDLFETSLGIQFKAVETKNIVTTGTIIINAVKPGSGGNVPANAITQMPVTITGITSITNLNATYDGYDAESDASLKERYYEALRRPPTSGNKYHYLTWAKEVVGVGNALVFPTWNGDNTVKVVIVDDNRQPANSDLVNRVQAYIDPLSENNMPKGDGSGEAPIGAHCTVESASAKYIIIKVHVTKTNSNYTDNEIITNITNNVVPYFKEIALSESNSYVSYAKIGNLIITADGVADYDNSSFTINDTDSNIQLSLMPTLTEIPVLKQVILI